MNRTILAFLSGAASLLAHSAAVPLSAQQAGPHRRQASPSSLITEFFKTLNDISEDLLQGASARRRAMEPKVLQHKGAKDRENILEMRRGSIEVARDMAYKRTAMLDLVRERPVLFPADETDLHEPSARRKVTAGR